jgi:ASC-1-like (ASCH) protein
LYPAPASQVKWDGRVTVCTYPKQHSPEPCSAGRSKWPESGVEELTKAIDTGRWPDGERLGTVHYKPWLQPQYARAIAAKKKPVEGRPRCGWAAKVKEGDAIRFTITRSGRKYLCVRVVGVERFESFADMLQSCGLQQCLPDFDGDITAGVSLYRSFATTAGPYNMLEATNGVCGIHVVPLSQP